MEGQILKILSVYGDEGIETRVLSKKLAVQKSHLNSTLYHMMKQKLVLKISDSPPVWKLSRAVHEKNASTTKRKHGQEIPKVFPNVQAHARVTSLSEAKRPMGAKMGRQEQHARIFSGAGTSSGPRGARGPGSPRHGACGGPMELPGAARPPTMSGPASAPSSVPPSPARTGVGRGFLLRKPMTESSSNHARPPPPHEVLKRQKEEGWDWEASLNPAQRQRLHPDSIQCSGDDPRCSQDSARSHERLKSAEPRPQRIQEHRQQPRPLQQPQRQPQPQLQQPQHHSGPAVFQHNGGEAFSPPPPSLQAPNSLRAFSPTLRAPHPQQLAKPQAPSPVRQVGAGPLKPHEWSFPAPNQVGCRVRPSILDLIGRPRTPDTTSRRRQGAPPTQKEQQRQPPPQPPPEPQRVSVAMETGDVEPAEVLVASVFASWEPEAVSSMSMDSLLAELPNDDDEEEDENAARQRHHRPEPHRRSGVGPPPPPAAVLGLAPNPDASQRSESHQLLLPSPEDTLRSDRAATGPGAEAAGGPGSALSVEAFAALTKNPVSVLHEFAQQRGVACAFEVVAQGGPAHRPRLEMCAHVGSRFFPSVVATSKKDARREAADRALRCLLAEGLLNNLLAAPGPGPGSGLPGPATPTDSDRVAHLAHVKFAELAAESGESLAGRKVLAAIVERRADSGLERVVALGTGNRCVTGLNLSMDGMTVNDSHAEIITRRSFMRYLYRQLMLAVTRGKELQQQPEAAGRPEAENECILEPVDPHTWRVRPDISFHLYISTAPCGDGALFCSRESPAADSPSASEGDGAGHRPTFPGPVHGLLRTKVEGGEGTIPVEAGQPPQTMDGIARGERLRTMSCSDKVCRWNLLGLQGALLSHLLEPVYLASLTVGLLFEHGHLSRAVCCRLDHGPEPNLAPGSKGAARLPRAFRINHPALGRVRQCDPQRELDKTSERSMNWCAGDPSAEVMDGTTGRCLEKVQNYPRVSRLAKRPLFMLFRELSAATGRTDLIKLCNSATYAEAKQSAEDYKRAKTLFRARFKAGRLGSWVSKPGDQELFKL